MLMLNFTLKVVCVTPPRPFLALFCLAKYVMLHRLFISSDTDSDEFTLQVH